MPDTENVEITISVPELTYERVERLAKKNGMSTSQFFAAAAERYTAELESPDLTDAINAVADEVNADESTQLAVAEGKLMYERLMRAGHIKPRRRAAPLEFAPQKIERPSGEVLGELREDRF